ncbi:MULTISPECIES: LiaF transmembrane domain-containing protein [Paenibacillus]|uniref:LiaF transmembrane domain-containing protein n=1 Tax=Paenibacillus lutrae TaxID=2078573 RepID=A0A7X3JZB9_9BACL|nr:MULTISPECIES: hypothetical protein [Paenibacillus]MVO99795.1 hypothetical protein [Paenibacillus lutrae]
MKRNPNMGLALVLIVFGAWMILNMLGIHLGPIMSYLIPIAMVVIGYMGIKRGSKLGWVIALFGIFALLGKMTTLFIILIAVAMIAFGVSMLKGTSNT